MAKTRCVNVNIFYHNVLAVVDSEADFGSQSFVAKTTGARRET